MSDVFISYARSTAEGAHAVAEALRGLGYSVWIDDDLPAHRTYGRVIEEQMAAARAAVVIWSADAVQSEWVLSEANRARVDHKLVQVITDKTRLPMPFDQIQCADLSGWSGDAAAPGWRKVAASIAELVGARGTPPNAPAVQDPPQRADADPGQQAILIAEIEGASAHWLNHRSVMQEAARAFETEMRAAAERHGGDVFRTSGEALFAAFRRPADAAIAARDVQQALAARTWPGVGVLRARMAIDHGAAERRDGDYFGAALNRCARLLALGHGGQVLATERAAEALASEREASLQLRSLGAHLLDDPLQAVGIRQVLIEGLPQDFPPLRLPDAHPNNLPKRLAALIGRQTEMGQLAAMLKEADLVTVTGTGGVGKTRIAVEVGLAQLGDYEDGVWLAELAPVSDPDLVPGAVARAMSIELPAGQDPLAALVDRLAPRRCLILLDNCEHVIDAVAALAQEVLEHSSKVKLLASSQELLGVEGEQAFRLRSLGEPDAAALFSERAHQADGAFKVTAQNAPAVAAICQRLDGIPLAIEMAAARAPSLGCEGVLQRLDDRFRMLTGGRRTALPRQRTLLATLDWSHGLLSEGDAAVFRRLGVFAGGFSLDAASKVAADEAIDAFAAIDALSSLVAKSLVVAETGDNRARYRLLETTRAYALEKLAAAGETAATQRRHAEYFLGLVTPSRADYLGHVSDDAFTDRYCGENDNIERALDWAFGPSGDAELGIALTAASYTMWAFQTLFAEYIRWLEIARARLGPATPALVRARLASAHASAEMMTMSAKAVGLADAALEASRDLGDPLQKAEILNAKGFALWFTGGIAEALAVSAESVALTAGLPPSRLTAQSQTLAGFMRFIDQGPAVAEPIFDAVVADLRSFAADGLANFFFANGRYMIPRSDLDLEIAEWRDLLGRVRPAEMLVALTTFIAVIQLSIGLARRAAPGDLDDALAVCRTHVQALPAERRYALALPLAFTVLKRGRAADAARLLGFWQPLADQAGTSALNQERIAEFLPLINAPFSPAELAALHAEGARMSLDEALALAFGEG